MAFKSRASGERPTIQTSFYTGKVIEVGEVQENEYGYFWDIVWKHSEFSFDIKKRIFFKEDQTWIFDRVFQHAKCQPIAVTIEDDEKINEWEESSLVGKELMALVYQGEYTEIFDFLPTDASDEIQTALMVRYKKWQAKRLNGDSGNGNNGNTNVMETVTTESVKIVEEDDLPF